MLGGLDQILLAAGPGQVGFQRSHLSQLRIQLGRELEVLVRPCLVGRQLPLGVAQAALVFGQLGLEAPEVYPSGEVRLS